VDKLQADYLIIGSGAVGMAFLDVLMSHSDATAIVVDRHHAPGGHWNDAYPFIRLHQPSAYYGVCSRALGTDSLDPDPLNFGMLERASAAELLDYYAGLMQEYIKTGRVTYLPMSDYLGDGNVKSLISDKTTKVAFSRKLVDTTYLQSAVPSTHPPCYAIGAGVTCITPNALPKLKNQKDHFTVVGAGKTGVDVCLFLLANGVDPALIRWIMPRDAWYQNRSNVQRGAAYFEASFGGLAHQVEAVAGAASVDEALLALEAEGQLLRLDPNVMPHMYHGAIMSADEFEKLRTIKDVVRQGRIVSITPDQIHFASSSIFAHPGTFYVDCSASGVTKRPLVPIFSDDQIIVQSVRPIQPIFSAALVARVELLALSEGDKNALCTPVNIPDKPADWLTILVEGLTNQSRWGQSAEIKAWIASTRLNTFGNMARDVAEDDMDKRALLKRFAAKAGPAVMNAKRLLKQVEQEEVA
jgi:hypothetical protein